MSKNTEVFKRLEDKLERLVKDSFTQAVTQSLANDIAQQIKKRTRLGYGVDESGNQVRLAPLKESTIQRREDYSENLSDAARPSRSSLTATGQLLDAIKGVGSVARVEITIKGNRTKELDGSRSRINNTQLSKFVQVLRPFFGLTRPERNRFVRQVKDTILRAVKTKL